METVLNDAMTAFQEAIDRRDPEAICVAARLVRFSSVRARNAYLDVWDAERSNEVQAAFARALRVLREIMMDAQSPVRALAEYAHGRVTKRYQALFPDEPLPE